MAKTFTPPATRLITDEEDEKTNQQNDYKVVDEESYGGKEGATSLKDIILQHIRAITKLSCQEFTPSYWQKKPMKVGDGVVISEVYHEDKRLAFSNAVDILVYIIWAKSDDEFKNEYKLNKSKNDVLFEYYKRKDKSQDDWVWKKLEFAKNTFWSIMIMIERTGIFEGEIYQESE